MKKIFVSALAVLPFQYAQWALQQLGDSHERRPPLNPFRCRRWRVCTQGQAKFYEKLRQQPHCCAARVWPLLSERSRATDYPRSVRGDSRQNPPRLGLQGQSIDSTPRHLGARGDFFLTFLSVDYFWLTKFISPRTVSIWAAHSQLLPWRLPLPHLVAEACCEPKKISLPAS